MSNTWIKFTELTEAETARQQVMDNIMLTDDSVVISDIILCEFTDNTYGFGKFADDLMSGITGYTEFNFELSDIKRKIS